MSVGDLPHRGQRFAQEQLRPGRVSYSTRDGFNSIRGNCNHPWNEVIIAPSSNDQVCLLFLLTSQLNCPRPLNSKYCSNNMPWVQWVHDTVCQQGNDPYPAAPWPGRLRNQSRKGKQISTFCNQETPLTWESCAVSLTDASWESTSPLCQPVSVAANSAGVIHLWSLFSMTVSLEDDSNSVQGSTCSLKPTKISLHALLYIHNSWSWPRAWQPQTPDTAELSLSEAAPRFPRQSSYDSVAGVQFQPKKSGLRMSDADEDRWANTIKQEM